MVDKVPIPTLPEKYALPFGLIPAVIASPVVATPIA